jgi:hypothetical protein
MVLGLGDGIALNGYTLESRHLQAADSRQHDKKTCTPLELHCRPKSEKLALCTQYLQTNRGMAGRNIKARKPVAAVENS